MSDTILSEVTFRFAAGNVPDDAWNVVHMQVTEAMSELYRASVVLTMETGGASLETLLGTPATLRTVRGGVERAVKGIVHQVEELGTLATHRFVRVDVVPSLWVLSQRMDTRLFQEMNVVQIAQAVFRGANVYQGASLEVDASLQALPPREYCVQFHETDLAFVRRLFEDEGIPFYFKHDGDGEGEALVLAGDEHAWSDTLPGGAPARVADAGATTASAETVHWFDERHTLRPTSVLLRDYDFTRPRATLDMTAQHPADAGRMPIYEYPARAAIGGYDEGSATYQQHNTRRLARVRLEEHRTRDHVGQGRSNLHALTPGHALAVAGHERAALDRKYLVSRVEHTGQAWHTMPADLLKSPRARQLFADIGVAMGAAADDPTALQDRYVNRFSTHRVDGMETTVPFRPERVTPRPVIEGPQTARVVGPSGEDIHTDKHGRIKVQFHWDRVGREDENSSCWIRVAQNMGGAGWGFVFIPRIGMEVVVQFIEGDPDRPLVTSVVYNGENPTPYGLPEEKTKTSLKTWSTPKTGGYNEMRFEDMAGLEQLYTQAERNMDTLVKNDQSLMVNRHRAKHIQGNETNNIDQNRQTQVGGHEAKEVQGNQDNQIHGPQGQSTNIDANQIMQIGQKAMEMVGQLKQVTVGKSKLTMDAEGNITLEGSKIVIKASGPVTVNGSVIDLN
ncbi:MAG: type VI secretion system tip protein TssI/VgrG [Polyangiales bacterium]